MFKTLFKNKYITITITIRNMIKIRLKFKIRRYLVVISKCYKNKNIL